MSDKIVSFMLNLDSPHRLGESVEKELREEGSVVKWLKSKDDVYTTCTDSEVVEKLAAGTYYVFQDSRGGTHAQRFDLETDELYYLPNNHITEVVEEIAKFWEKADKFKQYKFKHKRGVLFEGPGGTGKTSMINLLSSALIDNGGLVFHIDGQQEFFWYIEFIHNHLRVVEPERPIIAIIEDIDKYVDGGGMESALLNFLDGSDSVDHQVVVATTNRFDELNDLLLRPSRFDHHIFVDKPTQEVREAYLIKKGLDEATAKEWAKDTTDFSLAELKELISSVLLLDIEYSKAKSKITGQAENVVNKTSRKKKSKEAGFGFKLGKKD